MFRQRRLERLLRAKRPLPDDDFVRKLAARIEEDRAPANLRPSPRLGLALAVAVVALVAAGLTGGLSYAAGAVGHASSSVVHTVKSTVHSGKSHPSTSGSLFSGGVSASSTEYTSAGFYCLAKVIGPHPPDHGTFELYISTPWELRLAERFGFVPIAYYPSHRGPCPPRGGH